MTTVEAKAPAEVRKFPLTTLITMVVGSMVGAGVFSLPRNVALATRVFGALAWTMMAAEVLYVAAKNRDMPSFLSRTSGKNVPADWRHHHLGEPE